uniref:Uncharacterized protein n=1 Tax=Astyanax mexicanus TaxID=7994 RepID=A0A3B1JPH2_ASTMX
MYCRSNFFYNKVDNSTRICTSSLVDLGLPLVVISTGFYICLLLWKKNTRLLKNKEFFCFYLIKNLRNKVKRKMDEHEPSNQAELLDFLHQEWHKVIQKQWVRLMEENMPIRIKTVIKNQGYSTK